jgi:hypothetical protein
MLHLVLLFQKHSVYGVYYIYVCVCVCVCVCACARARARVRVCVKCICLGIELYFLWRLVLRVCLKYGIK